MNWEERYDQGYDEFMPLKNCEIKKLIGDGKKLRILDVGCGCCHLVKQLRDMGHDAYGVDPNIPIYDGTRMLIDNGFVYKCTINDMNWEKGYDLIMLKLSLAFIGNLDEQVAVLHFLKKYCERMIIIVSIASAHIDRKPAFAHYEPDILQILKECFDENWRIVKIWESDKPGLALRAYQWST